MAYMVLQTIAKANSQCNGNGQFLTHCASTAHERISMELGIYNYVMGMAMHGNMWCCISVSGLGKHVIFFHMFWFLEYLSFYLKDVPFIVMSILLPI